MEAIIELLTLVEAMNASADIYPFRFHLLSNILFLGGLLSCKSLGVLWGDFFVSSNFFFFS